MAQLPDVFLANEVLTAAKLNLYMEYMDQLGVAISNGPNQFIGVDTINDIAFLSRPRSSYVDRSLTVTNTSGSTQRHQIGPDIYMGDVRDALVCLDARIQSNTGTGSYVTMAVLDESTVGSIRLMNDSTTLLRFGAVGKFISIPQGSSITMQIHLLAGTTMTVAQRRMTVIPIREWT